MMSEGETWFKHDGCPEGETVAGCERSMLGLVYCLSGNGTKHRQRLQIRMQAFANTLALSAMLPGCQLADGPATIPYIDLVFPALKGDRSALDATDNPHEPLVSTRYQIFPFGGYKVTVSPIQGQDLFA